MSKKLGIVDWGIGGLGVIRELRANYTYNPAKNPSILYFSDTGSTPYGMLSAKDLEARLRNVISFLRGRGASKIFFACNAASTALPRLSDLDDVSGVIAPTLERITKNRKSERIAIIGGRRTILSGVYATTLRARGFEVAQRIAQPLSGMIERGEQRSPQFEKEVRAILRGTHDCDALLLACTHYPAAMPVFEKCFRGHVIDPLPAIARSLAKMSAIRSGERAAFFTTGEARGMLLAAKKAWGDSFSEIAPERVRI